MFLELEFEELENAFDLELEQVTEISDGGYDRGYAEGYSKGDADGQAKGRAEGETEGFADALAKRTELVVTDSGEYVPEGESTGFKKVTVGIQKGEDLDAVVAEQAELIEELSATLDEKIGAYDVGYDAALEKLTDLVATENGEYKPSEGSTGFKSVSVNVQAKSDIDGLIERSITDVSSGATGIANYALYNWDGLKSANFPNAKIIGQYAFSGCRQLKSINFPELESISGYGLKDCRGLASVDFPKVTYIGRNVFDSCYVLKSVILRSDTVCELSSTNAFNSCVFILGTVSPVYNPNGDKDGYIYVPSHLVESYKSATNWATYSTQFRALEDYTVDGTINGALDPNKI